LIAHVISFDSMEKTQRRVKTKSKYTMAQGARDHFSFAP
jgi:hypothetical protein